jgi:hypothetical protein
LLHGPTLFIESRCVDWTIDRGGCARHAASHCRGWRSDHVGRRGFLADLERVLDVMSDPSVYPPITGWTPLSISTKPYPSPGKRRDQPGVDTMTIADVDHYHETIVGVRYEFELAWVPDLVFESRSEFAVGIGQAVSG